MSPIVAAACATTRSETPAASAAGGPPPAVAATPAGAGEANLRAVLAMPHRSDKNRARDQYRHPVATLSFSPSWIRT